MPLHFWLDGRRVLLTRDLSYLTRTADRDMGWKLEDGAGTITPTTLSSRPDGPTCSREKPYKYGNFVDLNGLAYNGGTDQKDADSFMLRPISGSEYELSRVFLSPVGLRDNLSFTFTGAGFVQVLGFI